MSARMMHRRSFGASLGMGVLVWLEAAHPQKVDVIVATGGGTTLSVLKQVTQTIPIIMTDDPDPVGHGFVA